MKNLSYLRLVLILWIAGGFSFNPVDAFSREISPFSTRNLNPFVRVFSWITSGQSRNISPKEIELGVKYEVGSNCSWDTSSSSEQIYLDGESSWTTFRIDYGLSTKVVAGIEIPFISHSTGYLDHFLDSWHHITGFPQGRRASAPDQRFRYAYHNSGQGDAGLQTSESGFGNILVFSSVQLLNNHSRSLLLYLSGTLPGRVNRMFLRKSRSDFSFLFSGTQKLNLGKMFAGVFTEAGVVFPGRWSQMESLQRPVVLIGRAGAGFELFHNFIVKGQVDINSPFYRSHLDQIGKWAGQLTVGGELFIPSRTRMEFGITEDCFVSTVPDFGIVFALHHFL